ncbi:flagellar basal body P-ring protein FlgI [Alienimonas californiensis]|uniref:Flagellar basal body P-ring protein n=1 Tax=Alienimonas californiensis TaxID=2527989 RepID=A0A517P3L6_9PLAN|nr:flagellar basal body P-ring protein FlgI [Alienimonas californiensis]QDT13965.1 flagellar basal body P-ring protein [Alienimonas californiensis]
MAGPAAQRHNPTAPVRTAVGEAPLRTARSSLTAAAALCGALAAAALAALPGCAVFSLPDGETFAKFNPMAEDKAAKKAEAEWKDLKDQSVTVETKYVGEYTSVTGRNAVVVSGVGLVTGLQGTGGNPVPNGFRTRLLEDIKTRGVTGGTELLASPNTALVVVTAYIPPLVDKGEPLDVEVRIPPGSNATDLSGGWLLECELTEGANVGGQFRSGKTLATATGPLLVRGSDDQATRRASLSRGKVLGGGITKVGRALEMRMHHRYKQSRMVQKVVSAIGKRFHSRGPGGVEESIAHAHTDVKITLDVPDMYKEDFPRFLRVVDSVAMYENPVARRLRIEQLEQELMEGPTAEVAAIRLEAVGEEATPILKRGLASSDEEVRFHSAVALAYLGRSDGLEVLHDAARDEPAFRVYALAALAAAGGPQAAGQLRRLLADPLPETRYGAFRALWSVAPDDAYLNHIAMRAPDPITGEPSGPPLFHLHPVRVDGVRDLDSVAEEGVPPLEPLVHINHNRRAEVALFGPNQRFVAPLTLRAGRLLVGCPPRGDTVTVSLIAPGREDVRETGTKIVDVIAACVELGASYPDIAGMLQEAEAQHNLPGQLAVDALPVGGRVYQRKGKSGGSAPVGAGGLTPNLYRGSAAPEDPNAVERFEPDEDDPVVQAEQAKEAGDADAPNADKADADASKADGGDSEDDGSAPAQPRRVATVDLNPDPEPEPGVGSKFKALFQGVGDAWGGSDVSEEDWGTDVE